MSHYFITIVLVFALAVPCRAQESVIIFGNSMKPPKTWSENGTPKGIMVDILREIEKRTDITFDIRLFPWARAYCYAKEGRGGVYGFSKTTERLKLFDYSDPIFNENILLVTLKGKEFPFESLSDLKGKTIGVTRGARWGDAYAKAMQTIFTPNFTSNPEVRLRMLLAGRIDAAVVGPGKAGLLHIFETDPFLKANADKFVFLKKPLVADPNHIGFLKTMKKAELIKKINMAIRIMWQDGTIDNIGKKYACPR